MDPEFCVLLNLAIWLEEFLGSNPGTDLTPYVLAFLNSTSKPHGGKLSKEMATRILRQLLGDPEFELDETEADLLGSHSIRKFASTWCRRCGASKDDKDLRGRWRKKRVSEI